MERDTAKVRSGTKIVACEAFATVSVLFMAMDILFAGMSNMTFARSPEFRRIQIPRRAYLKPAMRTNQRAALSAMVTVGANSKGCELTCVRPLRSLARFEVLDPGKPHPGKSEDGNAVNAAAAPATVSGRGSAQPLRKAREGARLLFVAPNGAEPYRKPGDLPRPAFSNNRAG